MFVSTGTSRVSQRLFIILPVRPLASLRFRKPYHDRRQYASTLVIPPHLSPVLPNAPLEGASVAVLGGGITGLVSTYLLNKYRPDLKITLFESSHRLGGWLQSTKVDVGNGHVVFEQGPRSLRPAWPNGYYTLRLIDDLEMGDRLISIPKTSPAAQNRFIYYPDHLVRMPGPGTSILENLHKLFTEPLFDDVPKALLNDMSNRRTRSPQIQDESIGSFISRRFSPSIADDIVSAVFHGIYAGDIYNLSARSIMPVPYFYDRSPGSISQGAFIAWYKSAKLVWRTDFESLILQFLKQYTPSPTVEEACYSSVFTFKEGVGELTDRLEQKLIHAKNVEIYSQCSLESVAMKGKGKNGKVGLTWVNRKNRLGAKEYSHVISTLPAQVLAGIASAQTPLPSLATSRSVTVMVVNLFYLNPSILPVQGFGYLLPRSLPIEQNPERALGVIFDSHATVGQDEVGGTKLTVMFGGHWWDDFDSFPDKESGVIMAKRILARHLNITEDPEAVRVTLQKDCIPQYEVGHTQRMAYANSELEAFEGRLTVAGSSYTGVGLNDCVRAATLCAVSMVNGRHGTGLGSFAGEAKWTWEKRKHTPVK